MDKTYRTRTGMKIALWVLAIICAVFIVFLPASFLMLWLAHGAYVRITDDTLYVKWFGTRQIPWSDISSLTWGRAAGVAAMMRPLSYELHSKPRSRGNIAVGAFQNTDEIIAELTSRTGLTIT